MSEDVSFFGDGTIHQPNIKLLLTNQSQKPSLLLYRQALSSLTTPFTVLTVPRNSSL